MQTPDPPPPPATYTPEYADEAYELCLLGDMDDEAIASAMKVSVETLREWRATIPDFAEALRQAGKLADGGAAKGLHRRATGYDHRVVRVFMPGWAKEPVRAEYERHLPPHPASAMRWLEARHRKVWGNKVEIEKSVTNDIEQLKKCSSDELWAIVARELRNRSSQPPGGQG